MSRLGLLRMKRTAASYGQPLTVIEQIELSRLEAEQEDRRHGWLAVSPHGDTERGEAPVATLVYEV